MTSSRSIPIFTQATAGRDRGLLRSHALRHRAVPHSCRDMRGARLYRGRSAAAESLLEKLIDALGEVRIAAFKERTAGTRRLRTGEPLESLADHFRLRTPGTLRQALDSAFQRLGKVDRRLEHIRMVLGMAHGIDSQRRNRQGMRH